MNALVLYNIIGMPYFVARGLLELIFAESVRLASQSPYPIIVYSAVANYRPHLSHFWANV